MNFIYCKKQRTNGDKYILKIIKNAEELVLLILEKGNAYTGSVSENYLNETAGKFSMSYEVYCSSIENYIMGTDPDINTSFTSERFSISKKVGKMVINHFSVMLKQVNFGEIAMNVAEELLSLHRDTELKVVEVRETLIKAQESRDLYKEKLENYTQEHTLSENQLYSSFLLLINEKKRQIQFYKDLLDNPAYSSQKSRSPTRVILSDDENSESYNTDDEKELKLAENDTNEVNKRSRSPSFDSDEEPMPGPSKAVKWMKSKSDDLNLKSKNESASTSKKDVRPKPGDLRSKSDNFDLRAEDFEDDFGLFNDFSPPAPSLLPKRVKSASSRATVLKIVPKNSQIVQNNAVTQESPEVTEESPTLNFTTQDLFDRM